MTEIRKKRRWKDLDFPLLTLILLLMAIGLLMVFSASSYYAMFRFGDKFEFFLKQAVLSVAGVVVMVFISRIDYHVIGKISPILALVGLALIWLVALTPLGYTINGAKRWINLGFTTVQPSEFMKIAIILALSFSLSQRQEVLKSLKNGLFPYLVLVGLIDAGLFFQKHYSALGITTLLAIVILFVAGAKIWHFIVVGVPAGALLGVLLFTESYRVDRMMTFLGKTGDVSDDAYQITNSLIAIGSGGLFGKGLGRSLQKNLFIPEPQSDFIFPILAEELGFIGAVTLLLLFVLLFVRGMRVAMNAPDMMGTLMAVGITSLVAIQTLLNLGVVTQLLPTTGIPLPFFSAGGTSLLFLMVAMGVLLNISRQTVPIFRAGTLSPAEAEGSVRSGEKPQPAAGRTNKQGTVRAGQARATRQDGLGERQSSNRDGQYRATRQDGGRLRTETEDRRGDTSGRGVPPRRPTPPSGRTGR